MTKYVFCFLWVISALYSCTKPSSDGSGEQNSTDITDKIKECIFVLKGAESLKEGDSMVVFVPSLESSYTTQIINSEGMKMLPLQIEDNNGITTGDAIYACTPSAGVQEYKDPTKVVLSIPSEQKQSENNFDLSQFPLVSEPFIADRTLPTNRKELAGTINTTPLYAIARFDICIMQNLNASQKVESVTLTSDGIAGNFSYDLTSNEGLVPALDKNSITTQVEGLYISSMNSVVSVYMALAPGEHSGAVVAKIGETEISLVLENATFECGRITPVGLFVQDDITGGNEEFNPSEDFDWEE